MLTPPYHPDGAHDGRRPRGRRPAADGERSMGTSIEVSAGSSGASVTTNGGFATALGRDVRPRPETVKPIQRIADADRGTGGESLADFLGYFSIGLGLAEAVMPGVMARVIGIDHGDETNRLTLRLMGLREI